MLEPRKSADRPDVAWQASTVLRLFLVALGAKLLAIGFTVGTLFGLVLIERGVLAVLPEAAARTYRENAVLAPAIAISLTFLVLFGSARLFSKVEAAWDRREAARQE
jgi:hypothetical protein